MGASICSAQTFNMPDRRSGGCRYYRRVYRNPVQTILLHCAGVWSWCPIHNGSSFTSRLWLTGLKVMPVKTKKEEDLRQAEGYSRRRKKLEPSAIWQMLFATWGGPS
ncbi:MULTISPECIES: hypothetical protein [Rhizobium/Agrobacterium group]|jgi:hypothetical protein|uniref:hypothetical protein n=1 Tax=Rhizobium/Agrobacterium group TaxID=227290 RepID=UPI00122CA098|nr:MULTISPECIES: hypothetical protein [Rhizobium/Agrobacterium group]NSZ33803.1 hypothetical protein [Agrobacterium tumefaciens]QLG23576.1 hypothetical protein EML4_14285 [Agrobacterium tumefaciens]UXS89112.1 hypothetical protein FY144_23220 [Agrobacterium tumefaciens]